MTVQILEILALGIVAAFVLQKLFNVLGTTQDDDPVNGSFFGESSQIKDVTNTGVDLGSSLTRSEKSKFSKEAKELCVEGNVANLAETLEAIMSYVPNLTPRKFIAGSKAAFTIITEAVIKEDSKALQTLVDKKFLEKFSNFVRDKKDLYKKVVIVEVDAKMSDAYIFASSILFIKVLFTAKDFSEEWTFSRSTKDNGYNWYLIDVA